MELHEETDGQLSFAEDVVNTFHSTILTIVEWNVLMK